MAFEDLGNWAELTGLKLPIAGKVYTLPPVGAVLGVRIMAIWGLGANLATGKSLNAADVEVLSDEEEQHIYQEILGPVWFEMHEDDVPWAALKHAAMTAMIDVVMDRERAEIYWSRLGKTTPATKPAKKPADRKPRKATATRTSTASTAGTTSRPKPTPRKSAAAPRGGRSSTAGA